MTLIFVVLYYLRSLKKIKTILKTLKALSIILLIIFIVKDKIASYFNDLDFTFLLRKINSLLYSIGFIDQTSLTSRSVGYRIFIIQETIDGILDSFTNIIFGHIYNLTYWYVDSQILTYLGSFGVPMALFFLCLNIFIIRFLIKNRNKIMPEVIIIYFFIIIMLFVNRILDYFPIMIFFIATIKNIEIKSNQKLCLQNQ